MTKLKTRAIAALDWVDEHWSMKRMVASIWLQPVTLILPPLIALGIARAHSVETAGEIVPEDLWLKMTTPEGAETALEEIILVSLGVPALAVVDVAGRITHAYLPWIPEVTVHVFSYGGILLSFVVVLINIAWAYNQILQSGWFRTAGDIDG